MLWLVLPLLDRGDVLRLHALLATSCLVGDLGALLEGLKPAACYRAVVHEEIIAPVVGLDKAVALLVVEPLDCPLGHVPKPAFLFYGVTPALDCGGNIAGSQERRLDRSPSLGLLIDTLFQHPSAFVYKTPIVF